MPIISCSGDSCRTNGVFNLTYTLKSIEGNPVCNEVVVISYTGWIEVTKDSENYNIVDNHGTEYGGSFDICETHLSAGVKDQLQTESALYELDKTIQLMLSFTDTDVSGTEVIEVDVKENNSLVFVCKGTYDVIGSLP